MQEITGGFDTKIFGTRFFFVSKTVLNSNNGNRATVYSIHLTPFFAFGVTINNKN